MTQEEKARAYDEALKRADSLTEKYGGREFAEYVFPELAESDERIRKELKEAFEAYDIESTWNGIPIRSIFAWLEKQKEPHYTKRNALFDKCVENCDPKTVEEVNKRVDDIMNMPKLSPFEQALTNFIGDWEDDEEHWPSQFVKKHGKHILDIAREELQKEQKPAEWSEEDQLNLNWVIAILNGEPCDLDIQLESLISWLKSLRPQSKKELSIEKAIQWLDDTFYFLDNSSGRGRDCEITTHDFDSLEEMYDSFRKAVIVDSEPHWKPSEEQMEALNALNLHGDLSYVGQQKQLISLYQDLKKLM